MARLIQQHQGRVVNAPGDALLAEFESVVDAVKSAVEIQTELAKRNAELPTDRQDGIPHWHQPWGCDESMENLSMEMELTSQQDWRV